MREVSNNIDKYGWHLTGVFPTEDAPMPTYFCYTTGLIERGHPELVTFGLQPRIAHMLMTIAYDEFIKKGRVFQDGETVAGLANLPVFFRSMPADHPEYPLGTGRRLYGVDTFPALQMVLPDAQGRFPWDPGCDEKMIVTQQLTVPDEAGERGAMERRLIDALEQP